MDREYFSQKIRALRKDKGLTQEQLARDIGLSVQAVSKWECAASYPDIEMLVRIAEYFGTGIGELLTAPPLPQENTGEEHPAQTAEKSEKPTLPEGALSSLALPSDNVLYVVQIYNGRILRADENTPDSSISIEIPEDIQDTLNVTVYGSICGDVNAGGNISCGDVDGDVDAGGNVSCENVDGDVNAGGNVSCEEVAGDVDAGGDISCENVEGNVSAGGDISCENVEGNVSAGGNVSCGDVDGDVNASGDVTCGDIGGDVNADTVEQ